MKKKENPKKILLTLLIAHCSLLIVFCKTAPVVQELSPEATGRISLEPGGLAYVFVDTKKAEPILRHITVDGLDKDLFQQMVDMTNFAAAAVYPKESGKRFRLAAQGGYPVSKLELGLGVNRDWKKHRSAAKAEYWYSSKMKLSAAFNAGQAFLLATEGDSAVDPFNTQSTEVPDGFVDFIRGAVVSSWYEKPGDVISKKLREAGIALEIPAERLFIGLFQKEEQPGNGETLYEAHLRVQLQSTAQVRMIASFLAIARNALSSNIPAGSPAAPLVPFFANQPVTDGTNIDIKTGTLNGREIALLFNLFSL